MANRFAECTAVDEVIRQAVGAGSMCWDPKTAICGNNMCARVFDSDEAVKVADEAYERVMELVVALVAGRQSEEVPEGLIARAEVAVADATPGPWVWDCQDGEFMGCGQVFTMGEDVMGGSIAAPSGDCYPRSGYNPKADMQFIAAARALVPELVAALRGESP